MTDADTVPINPGARWFVVQSQPHKELLAARNLENQDYRVFLPRLKKTVRHARRSKTVHAALFPRYLFVALDIERDRWRSVLGTVGVVTMIMDSGGPKPVPGGVVETLCQAAASDGIVTFTDSLALGARVRFLDGPFAEQVGEVVRLDDKDRVAVLMELMGGERLVVARPSSLMPVDA